MKTRKEKVQFKKSSLLITSMLISLSLLSISNVQAEQEVDANHKVEVEFIETLSFVDEERKVLEQLLLNNDDQEQLLIGLENHRSLQFDVALKNYKDYQHSAILNDEEKDLLDKLVVYAEEALVFNEEILKEIMENQSEDIKNSEKVESTTKKTEQTPLTDANQGVSSLQSLDIKYTADQYYKLVNDARQASTAWEIAMNYKKDYPKDSRVYETINRVADRIMILGKDAHQSQNYELATLYYNRLLNESLVRENLSSEAKAFYNQASNQETIKYGYHYNQQIFSARQGSTAWNLAQKYKRDYPLDYRLPNAINHAANRNFTLGKSSHQANNFELAQSYYKRLIDEPMVDSSVRSEANIFYTQASNHETIKYGYHYNDQIYSTRQASTAWDLALKYKRDYPNDHRLPKALNHAAERNALLGKEAHKSKDFVLALTYYNRIVNEPLISTALQTEIKIHHRQALNNETFKTADMYYQIFKKKNEVTYMWSQVQNFKKDYPDDYRLKDVLNEVASDLLDFSVQIHKKGDYKKASEHYEALVADNLVISSTKELARGYLAQANRNEMLQSPESYYEKVLSARQASESWDLALIFKKDFPNHELFILAINDSAERNLELGLNAHKAKNYSLAELYYNRIKSEGSINENISIVVNELQKKAKDKSPFNTPTYYYNKSTWASGASDAWRYAIEGITVYPNNELVSSALNDAAERNLRLGINAHQKRDYKLATLYYMRLANQEDVDPSYKTKAESYQYLAKNRLQLTNTILRQTKYDLTLDEVLNLQMNKKPQTSSNGRWIDASRKEVEKYVNPLHFIPSDIADITTSLVTLEIKIDKLNVRSGPSTNNKIVASVAKGQKYTIIDYSSGWFRISGRNIDGWIYNSSNYVKRDNNLMQFLILSGSSGISSRDLNTELLGHGILSGRGDAFRKASIEANINEIYLIAHAILETGRGSSELANGIVVSEVDGKKVTPRKVYNMYGIGAFDSNPEKYGSERAYKEGWFTPDAAIIGGAKWISVGYINNPLNKQDTLYKMRWNPDNPGFHQYATDIGWAYKQMNNLNHIILLSQKYDLVMNFDLPLYK